MTKTALSKASAGDSCLVLHIEPDPPELRSRLYTLGIIPGSLLKVLRFAPLGDPMQLRVGGSFISIRKAEADVISVEVQ
ncbi:MAG: ferrous iron transport protein A [Gammaproteobacteria bacterium]|nr:ferrous iron transport protein A [Gammaproteobacteria bacterium]